MRHALSSVLLAAALLPAPPSLGADAPETPSADQAAVAERRAHALERFPPAQKGMVRHVFHLPKDVDPEKNRLELIAGKTGPADAFPRVFEGAIVQKGDFFVVETTGKSHPSHNRWFAESRRRFWLVGDAAWMFSQLPPDPEPVVVYAPEGFEVRHRVWAAEKEAVGAPPAGTEATTPATAQAPEGEIAWQDLVTILREEGIVKAMQTHARHVTVTTGTGKRYTSTEPAIDDILKLEKEVGGPRIRTILPNGHVSERRSAPVIATE